MTIDLRNAPKECACITHEGPCWLEMDRLWFDKNLRLLKRGGRLIGRMFSQAETRRLHEKHAQMCRYTADPKERFIFPDGYGEKDYNDQIRAFLQTVTT